MSEINQLAANVFTKISHHRNVSVVYLTQNLFDKKDATSAPYGHLLIDLKPDQNERCRLRTIVFPGEMQ